MSFTPARLPRPQPTATEPSPADTGQKAQDKSVNRDNRPAIEQVPVEGTSEFEFYEEASLSIGLGAYGYSEWSDWEINKLMFDVVAVEGPIHIEMVVARLRKHARQYRVSRPARRAIVRQVDLAVAAGKVKKRDDFLWVDEKQLNSAPRIPKTAESRRDVEYISTVELQIAVLLTVKQMFGGSKDEVILQTARNMGYQRTGSRINRRLEAVVDTMLRDKKLEWSLDSIIAK